MFKKTDEIIVSLGDDGAIVSCFKEGTLNKRIFVTSPLSSDFTDLAKSLPDASIYLLLDTIDQNYIFSSIPNVGKGNVAKIVRRKITTEFDPNDLNASMFLARESSSAKKALKYLFVSVRNGPPFKDWVDVLSVLPNRFVGIYLLPVESEDFIRKVRLATHGPSKQTPDEWEVFISYNRVGGFRQIVLKNGKLIFTRISQSVSLQTPDSVGRNISQEAANTLEYIRRIGFYDQTISVYIICAKDAATHIEIPGIKQKDVYIYNPFDLSNKLGIKNAAQEGDKFGDVIFAANFAKNKKKILKLTNKNIKATEKLSLVNTIFNLFSYTLIILLPVFAGYYLYETYKTSQKIKETERVVTSKSVELSNVKDFEKEYGIKPQMLIDVVKTKNELSAKDKDFFEVLSKYKEADTFSTYINSITMSAALDGKKNVDIVAVFDYAGAKSYSDILFMVEQYTTKITEAFKGDSVEFVGLPNDKDIKVDLENQKTQEVLVITVKIKLKK